MIEIKWNDNKLKSFYSKMDKLADNIKSKAKEGVNKSLEESQKYAKSKLRFNTDGKILTEISESKEIVGRIYTDSLSFSYAPFVEYGTGQYAELDHIGHSKLFRFSNMTCWYAPADKVKKQYRDDQVVEINGEMFPMNAYIDNQKYVMVFSQRPQPFMRPTAFNRREPNKKLIKEEIKKGIKEAIK